QMGPGIDMPSARLDGARGGPLLPRCTIITPCFNDGVFLKELRRSVEQGEAVHHVIVDDGSTDPITIELLASLEAVPGVTVLRTPRSGPAAARNLAIRAVETPYVMPVDADDTIMPGAIRDLADALDADSGLSVVWGDTVIFGARLAKVPSAADLDPWWFTFVNDVVVGLMGRTEALAQAGWDETSGYEDWGTTLALIGAGARGRNVGRVTYGYRSHTQSRRRNEVEIRDEEEIENLRTRYRWILRQRRELRRRSSAPFGVRVI
ncbi:MAG: glycosyltransferase family 2 protein, partial [Cryobacterium sp.]|nr:glycosyltransferase family 2 protein [Cryobacterium sp.]